MPIIFALILLAIFGGPYGLAVAIIVFAYIALKGGY